ncbi:D-alanyl-D-alanine carboxypeptidase [Nonlabens tegetincola]|uniref:M15 family metallopeptidase n=1 Tax=Nonlabens tegetincola TaxID=323273 RepID=UPI000A2066D1|nr:M15 family metallopeptidase [Nonlabens tegetincola]ARN71899.1 D-alanyl-D-alanine carboxypeptidase [Nonlabens tegetincola]
MRHLFFILLFCVLGSQDMGKLTGQSPNPNNLLEIEVQQAFDRMKAAAFIDGIELQVVSGYRSFERQQAIWNRKYKRYEKQGMLPDAIFDKIVEYSTVPGTSRHHWGTDLDIIDAAAIYKGDVLVPNKFHGNGPFCKMKEWMELHASKYGFELVYTLNENRTGFNYEPWHYSYVPLSRKRYKKYLEEIDLIPFLRSHNILGMNKISDGRLTRYLEEHIKGINPKLK